MKKLTILLAVLLLTLVTYSVQNVSAHCQIPCGIYDDEARFTELLEHCTTLEKSMNLINQLSADTDKDHNQIVRWVNNKEHHADDLTDIIVDYFMVQRIKEVTKDSEGFESYQQKITALHKIVRMAMKCKQTTEIKNVEMLRGAITDFKQLYTQE